jgi:hypothetical protein
MNMPGKKKAAGKFKSKGTNILKGQGAMPNSMKDFLEDTQKHKSINTQSHKNTYPESSNSTNEPLLQDTNYQKEELGRLHIQIRQDLIEKLLDTVFKRKRDRKIKNRNATQRAIIEEALEKYFMQDGV